ncbi:MAG: glycosyltransferase [Bacteroidales bacterium]|nr:glycosyltransferase [Bacteroidales bacterium]
MKKILIMMDSLGCGGAEKSLTSLLPFLSNRNYDLTLMLRKRGGEFEKNVPKNIRIKTFPYKATYFRQLLYSLYLRLRHNTHSAELYWQAIGKFFPHLPEKYDVAIAYQQGFPSFYIAEKVNAAVKFAWINTDLLKANYSVEFNQRIYGKFNTVVPVTDILSQLIQQNGYVSNPEKITVINDIINESVIRDLSNKRVLLFGNPEIRLTTVGRLVEAKGYDLAIKAARILKSNGVDFKWHFVGDGPLRADLERMVIENNLTDYIIFEGLQNNPYPYIKAADIYVQSSKFEGLCITVGEAKILGKSIVSTDFPVIHNQLINERNGLICKMTGESIAESIMRLNDNPELRWKLETNVKRETNKSATSESAKAIQLIEGK